MNKITLISALLFISGLTVQTLALGQFDSVVVTLTYMLCGLILTISTNIRGRYELNIYFLSFASNLFWAGISAIYRVRFNDPHQLAPDSDSSRFYALSSHVKSDLSLDQLRDISDGSGAVYVWRELYRTMKSIGIEPDPYIGITLNIVLVALTGVLAIKVVKAVWGNDHARLVRMTYLYSLCGIFWLYAANHLRDSFILFSMTLLLYLWVKLLVLPRLRYMVAIVIVSVVWIVNYKYMRIEFQYVPATVAAAGILAWLLCTKNVLSKVALTGVILIFGLIILLNYGHMSNIQEDVEVGKTWGGSASSLGTKYIVNTPLPVRAIVGTYYVHVFPIPFWAGFQLSTLYHLLKSLNAIFLFFVIPMGIVGAIKAMTLDRRKRSSPLMFSLFFYAGFSITVAITSLESRHLGAFLVALLILAVAPDYGSRQDKQRLKNWLGAWLSVIALVHLAWFALKL